MNRFRIKVSGVPADCIKVRSNLDRTHSLSATSDEDIVIGRDDVCVIKNEHEGAPAKLVLEGLHMRDGRCILRPARQSAFTLYKGRTIDVTLGPGEAMVVRSERARDPTTPGAQIAV